MKIGITTFVTDEGIAPQALAGALEERGFESMLLTEHSHIPVSRETPYPGGGDLPRVYYRTLDPFVSLGAAASVTSDLLVGSAVTLLTQRDTIHTANEVASLDHLSGGRAVFGVGVGWNREEMRNHGTDPRTRGRLLDEQLEAITELWSAEQAEYHGKHVNFDPVYAWPKPVRQPRPPIYIGGNSEAAARRAATHADGWMPNAAAGPEQIQPQLDLLAEQGGGHLPVFPIGADGRARAVLDGYAAAGIERVTLYLPTKPESDTLRILDTFAELVPHYAAA